MAPNVAESKGRHHSDRSEKIQYTLTHQDLNTCKWTRDPNQLKSNQCIRIPLGKES